MEDAYNNFNSLSGFIYIILWSFIRYKEYNHFLDILEERDIAEPPDLIEPWEDNISTELGALLGI